MELDLPLPRQVTAPASGYALERILVVLSGQPQGNLLHLTNIYHDSVDQVRLLERLSDQQQHLQQMKEE